MNKKITTLAIVTVIIVTAVLVYLKMQKPKSLLSSNGGLLYSEPHYYVADKDQTIQTGTVTV